MTVGSEVFDVSGFVMDFIGSDRDDDTRGMVVTGVTTIIKGVCILGCHDR